MKTPTITGNIPENFKKWNPWEKSPFLETWKGWIGTALSLGFVETSGNSGQISWLALGAGISGSLMVLSEWRDHQKKVKDFATGIDVARKRFSHSVTQNMVEKGIPETEIDHSLNEKYFDHLLSRQDIREFTSEILSKSKTEIILDKEENKAHWKFETRLPEETHGLIRYFIFSIATVSILQMDESSLNKNNMIQMKTYPFDISNEMKLILLKEKSFLGLLENPPTSSNESISFAPGTFMKRMKLIFGQECKIPDVRHYIENSTAKINGESNEIWLSHGIWKIDDQNHLKIEDNNGNFKVSLSDKNGNTKGEVFEFKDIESIQKTWGHLIQQEQSVLIAPTKSTSPEF